VSITVDQLIRKVNEMGKTEGQTIQDMPELLDMADRFKPEFEAELSLYELLNRKTSLTQERQKHIAC